MVSGWFHTNAAAAAAELGGFRYGSRRLCYRNPSTASSSSTTASQSSDWFAEELIEMFTSSRSNHCVWRCVSLHPCWRLDRRDYKVAIRAEGELIMGIGQNALISRMMAV